MDTEATSLGHIIFEGLLQPKKGCLFSEIYPGETLATVNLSTDFTVSEENCGNSGRRNKKPQTWKTKWVISEIIMLQENWYKF